MKPTLKLETKLKTTLNVQLQHSLKLLQLTSLDLQSTVQEALESNPLLQLEEPVIEAEPIREINSVSERHDEKIAPERDEWQNTIPSTLGGDTSWDDIYSNQSTGKTSEPIYLNNDSATETLNDHLLWQLNLLHLSPRDYDIATYIIDAITPRGTIEESTDELVDALNQTYQTEPIEHDEFEAVIKLVQQFEPAGIASRSLAECLLIQLNQLPASPAQKVAMKAIRLDLSLITKVESKRLAKRLKCQESLLNEAIELIQTLNPSPGDFFGVQDADYIIPDIIVTKNQQAWTIKINPDVSPKLVLNQDYTQLIKRGDKSDDGQYLKSNLTEAQMLIKGVESRFDTLLRVATEIVEAQQDFFELGPEAMRPLILSDIASTLEMHESTVSRATKGKFMATPVGVFEMKYFFSSHVGTSAGGEASATAVQAIIKSIISDEPPQKPLSDAKLEKLLAEKGINIARRTIAKYREALDIPPSSKRKKLR